MSILNQEKFSQIIIRQAGFSRRCSTRNFYWLFISLAYFSDEVVGFFNFLFIAREVIL